MSPELFASFVQQIQESFGYYLPEAALCLTLCAVIIVDLLLPKEQSKSLASLTFLGTVVSLILVTWIYGEPDRPLFQGMIVFDGPASFFKIVFLLGTIVTVGLTYLSKELDGHRMGEFYSILLAATLGAILLAEAGDFLTLYLGLELLSIPSFLLVAYKKDDLQSSEGSLKYVIYGAVASGLFLFGASLFYGLTGTTRLNELAMVAAGEYPTASAVAFFLMLGGFGYKIAAVPFHFWAPDSYEGAPTPVTAYLAVVSKAGGFAAFLRFLGVFGEVGVDWATVLAVVSAVTMTYGNLAALMQTSTKRLLAYSSVAHVGYALMGAAAMGATGMRGFRAVAFYLVAYLFMNLGAFVVLIVVENRTGSDDLEGFSGLGKRAPLLAVTMAICLFSLIGIPPTGGFLGKAQLFMVSLDAGLIWLVVLAAVNTAISVYYYVKIIRNMILKKLPEHGETPSPQPVLARLIAFAMLAGVLYTCILVQWGGERSLLAEIQRLTFFTY